MTIGRGDVRRGKGPLRVVAGMVCALALAGSALAATDYPTRTVRIIVPYGAGGIADVTMRLTAQKLSETLGQQFIVDNRPGAGGVVGARRHRRRPTATRCR
jgi:tripartite-type tricarboxylate transporter receptor subunit TctC